MNVVLTMRSQAGVPGGSGVPGGQIGMVQLARALARIGVGVELFAGGPRMPYLEGLDGVTTTFFSWPLWLDRLFARGPERLRRVGKGLRRRGWLEAVSRMPAIRSSDVVHVQGLQDCESLLDRFQGPLVVTHWGRLGRWQPQDPAAAERRWRRMRERVAVVAIGEAQAEELSAVGLPPAEVIPPGIDLEHFTPGDRAEARRRLALPKERGLVLYVGRLAPDKNVESLLSAFASQDPGRARLLIVGDGPLREKLSRMTEELGIAAATTFLPFVPHNDLPLYYRSADVMVVPSNKLETFCMVALEAIACRCPLIVTDQVPEILRRFPSVPSVEPYDVAALASKIAAGLDATLPAFGETAIRDFDWVNIARRYASLYDSMNCRRVDRTSR